MALKIIAATSKVNKHNVLNEPYQSLTPLTMSNKTVNLLESVGKFGQIGYLLTFFFSVHSNRIT